MAMATVLNTKLLGTLLLCIVIGILLYSFLDNLVQSRTERYWVQGVSIMLMCVGGLGLFMITWDKINSIDTIAVQEDAQEDTNKLT